MKISTLVLETCQKFPNQFAIHDEMGSFTYKELGLAITANAQYLKEQGVVAGMGLGIMGRNSRDFIILVFAALECGAVVMPISNQLKKAEVDTILKTAGLHYIIEDTHGPQLDKDFKTFTVNAGTWRMANCKAFTGTHFAPHIPNAAIIRYTSGTTGTSKGVVIAHESILGRIEAANKVLNLDEESTVIWVLQMSYHFVVSIILYLRVGASIALTKDFMAPSILDFANRFNGTLLYASPMHIRLLASDKSGQMMPSMKRVISTSTAISQAQCEAFEQRYQIPISQAYGIIEVGLPIINHQKSKEHPAAVGHALPDYEVEILNDEFEILQHGQIGHLAMRGPGMFDGYLHPPRMRADTLQNGWFLTGDLASKDASGLIKIEGRKKSMINVSGNKVFPEEVEHVLNQHPHVKLSKVKGFTHRFMGEMVMAEVILEEGQNIETEALIKFCRERLITYKVPQKIIFVDALAMTGSGKIKRD